MNNFYFDLHTHAAFKQYLTKFEDNYPTQRSDDLTGKINLKPVIDVIDEEILHILDSQSCIEQMEAGKVVLSVAGLHALERLFTGTTGFFGKILNLKKPRITPLDLKYFDKVRKGEISYYQLFLKEVDLYRKLRDMGRIVILRRKKEYKLDDLNKVHFVLSMEGAHALCRTKIGNPNVEDQMTSAVVNDPLFEDFRDNPVLTPAESLKHLQQALWVLDMDLFFISLTHLSHIPEKLLATHAYGMKMLKHDSAYPDGIGITESGKDLIDAAYNLKVRVNQVEVEAPVLIDIKHMSLKSRIDFYDFRRAKGYKKPIIVSHAAVTGYSIANWKSALEKAIFVNDPVTAVKITVNRKTAGTWGAIHKLFTFNSWSLNLMDEDIEEVINSEGLIGIELDVRVLGWQNVLQDTLSDEDKEEYLSVSEFGWLFPDLYHNTGQLNIEKESYLMPSKEERHALIFCFNIIHILSVGGIRTLKNPEEIWKCICIGSDFDGLINPSVNCPEADHMTNLENELVRWLPVAEEAYLKENGGPSVLPRNSKGSVDMLKLSAFVRNIMFNNGKDFLLKWLK